MKSRYAIALALSLGLIACGSDSNSGGSLSGSGQDPLAGGDAAVATAKPGDGTYAETPEAIADGNSLYHVHCVRCHGMNAEGGIGPAFTDADYIYGGAPEQLFASIAEGRPKGMPAHGDILQAQQIWHIVAYVKSLSH